jgi:hypothetical protein
MEIKERLQSTATVDTEIEPSVTKMASVPGKDAICSDVGHINKASFGMRRDRHKKVPGGRAFVSAGPLQHAGARAVGALGGRTRRRTASLVRPRQLPLREAAAHTCSRPNKKASKRSAGGFF